MVRVREPFRHWRTCYVPVYSTLAKARINIYREWNFRTTTVTIPALRLLHLRCCMGASIDHLSVGQIIHETTEKIVQIKIRIQATRDRQKIYADVKQKPFEFQIGDKVMQKVSPWKGVICFGKRGKLNPRYIGPFKIIAKKCMADEPLAIPLDEIQIDDELHFIEEPVEIIDHEVKRLNQSRIPIVKLCWNSRRGPEFTWEREDQMQKKYPHLFLISASVADATS
ncbi:hypothetical protein Tco_0141023 [Tanacetum coccineum]